MILMYFTIWIGLFIPVSLSRDTWIVIIMIYIFFASTMPVQRLLQPRDYINALELGVAMALLIAGIIIRPLPIVAPEMCIRDSWIHCTMKAAPVKAIRTGLLVNRILPLDVTLIMTPASVIM